MRIFTIAIAAILLFGCSKTTNPTVSATEIPQPTETPVIEAVKPAYDDSTPKVIGIGGVFFKSSDRAAMMKWYGENLGLAIDDIGSPFEFRNTNNPNEVNYLRWSPFAKDATYFEPSNKDFMINYRVQNIEGMVAKLKANNVVVLDTITSFPYGKFVHIMDNDSNKIELWEPIDSFFYNSGIKTTK